MTAHKQKTMSNAKRAAIASAFIFPGAGLFMLGHRLRGCIFALPAAAVIALLFIHLFQVAARLSAELDKKARQGDFGVDIPYLWNSLHSAVFESPYWDDGKWLLLAAWLCSIMSSYAVGKKMDLAAQATLQTQASSPTVSPTTSPTTASTKTVSTTPVPTTPENQNA
jgi:TM2 domain-containing membrane protein YozV